MDGGYGESAAMPIRNPAQGQVRPIHEMVPVGSLALDFQAADRSTCRP